MTYRKPLQDDTTTKKVDGDATTTKAVPDGDVSTVGEYGSYLSQLSILTFDTCRLL